ncbi:MAG: glycosyltransferase family 39 protein [Microbacterium sp.]
MTTVLIMDATSPTVPYVAATATARRRPGPWVWALVALAVVTFALTAWGVGGSMSEYYASIALSMSKSWPNFFFGSVDPAGTVTLDKIPGSFWIPALSARLFGFSAAAVIVPNALAATGAAVITAITARRWAGPVAGIVAGAVVATTPILIAVARSNQPETFFCSPSPSPPGRRRKHSTGGASAGSCSRGSSSPRGSRRTCSNRGPYGPRSPPPTCARGNPG